MKKIKQIWTKFHGLHLGLYLLFSIMASFGGFTAFFFEQYSLVDVDLVKQEFQRYSAAKAGGGNYAPAQGEWIRIFRPLNVTKHTEYRLKDGKLRPSESYKSDKSSSELYLLALLAWLWPLYRHRFSKKPQDPALIGRRITGLPLVIFLMGWVMAALRYLGDVTSFSAQYGPAPWRMRLVFAASALIFGAFVSYLNLELTGLYIRQRIAKPFFLETDPYGLKRGFAVSLTLRYALMLFSLAIVPLLLMLYVPVYANSDIFSSLAALSKAGGNWTPSYEQLRVVIPSLLMAFLTAVVLLFQAASILLYRYNVQKPASALVGRMKAVAAGDFGCKTTVLYADELGQLKGHFNQMLDGLVERDKIKDTFGRYVSMEIAEKIMKSGKVNLAGEEIQATVLFSDIRDFTPLSEKLPPPELIRFLNDYFSHITEPITRNRGVINKFIGDAVMAIFSPVFGVEDHQEAAVRAALGMREALARFNAQGRHPEVFFGVGVHSGGLVAGNVGTESRLEYTVLGDTVNVASRIESQTKAAATQVLVSEATFSGLAPGRFPGTVFTACPPVIMKGKSRPMVLYKAEPA